MEDCFGLRGISVLIQSLQSFFLNFIEIMLYAKVIQICRSEDIFIFSLKKNLFSCTES